MNLEEKRKNKVYRHAVKTKLVALHLIFFFFWVLHFGAFLDRLHSYLLNLRFSAEEFSLGFPQFCVIT